MRSWAKENTPGVAVESEFANFKDYYKSATGKNAVGLDWIAKWRTWMRNAYTKFGTITPPPPKAEKTAEQIEFAAAYAAAEAQWREGFKRHGNGNGVKTNA